MVIIIIIIIIIITEGVVLIARNDELCILYERSNLYESNLKVKHAVL